MTKLRTLLSVRMDPALAEALDRYCLDSGNTRSYVVQEGIAQYLVAHSGPTLSSLAEAVLPAPASQTKRAKPSTRQERYRKYVREKRRR